MNRHYFFPLYLIALSVFLYIFSPSASVAKETEPPLFSSSFSAHSEITLSDTVAPEPSVPSDADDFQEAPASSPYFSELETSSLVPDPQTGSQADTGLQDILIPGSQHFPGESILSHVNSTAAQETIALTETAAQETSVVTGTAALETSALTETTELETEALSKATPSQALKGELYRTGAPKKVASVQSLYGYVLFLSAGESLSSLPLDSHELANAYVTLEGERFGNLFPVHYNTTGFDNSSPGIQFLHGTVAVPQDYEISDELADIVVPVAVRDAKEPFEMPVTERLETIEPASPMAVPVGVSRQELEGSLRDERGSIEFKISGGYNWIADIIWDCGSVDTDTAGTYKVYSRLSLPEGVLVTAPVELPYAWVDIQDPDTLTLTAPVQNRNNGSIRIDWLKHTPDKEKFHFWYKKEGGLWTEDAEGEIMAPIHVYGGGFDGLFIRSYELDLNIPYSFYIEYEGEMSDTVQITMTPDGFDFTQIGGDRDGGDTDEQKPPVIVQPPPDSFSPETTPSETAPPETAPSETAPSETAPPETAPQDTVPSDTFPPVTGNTSLTDIPVHDNSSSGGTHRSSGPVRQPFDETRPETRSSISSNGLNSVLQPSDPQASAGSQPLESTDNAGSKLPESAASTAKPDADSIGPPAQEEDAADYTVWSGIRILKSMEMNPKQPLVFEKHGIRLELPALSGPLAHVTAGSSLKVEIRPLDKYRFNLSISMDGAPLSVLPGMSISLPWDASQPGADGENAKAWEVAAEDGTIAKAVYHSAKGRLCFKAQTTGTFTIRPVPTPPLYVHVEEPLASRLIPADLTMGCGVAAILAAALWIRRRHRRKRI